MNIKVLNVVSGELVLAFFFVAAMVVESNFYVALASTALMFVCGFISSETEKIMKMGEEVNGQRTINHDGR